MGLMDEMAAALSGGGEAQQAPLAQAVRALMAPDGPGLEGLLRRLREAGLEAAVASWHGRGRPIPVSPEQVRDALGEAELHRLAAASGLSQEEVTAKLSQHLPALVERLHGAPRPEGGRPA